MCHRRTLRCGCASGECTQTLSRKQTPDKFTQSGRNVPLSEEAYLTLKEDMLALAITVVDILNGAAYLFDQKPTVNNKHWKSDLELEDFRNSLGLATKSKSNC